MDHFRDNINLRLSCSICKSKLTIECDKSKKTANSAYEVGMEIFIIPCDSCKEKQDRLKDSLKVALTEVGLIYNKSTKETK